MCSTYFIINMTFERFYSIIRPHKAASFNTVKRAKITIGCIVLFSVLFNFSHVFITTYSERNCLAYAKTIKTVPGQMYYWMSFVLNFAVPFVSLLMMNIVIIHTFRTRSMKITRRGRGQSKSEGEGKAQGQNVETSEKQIYITLISVTFGFLILTTPGYVLVFSLSGMDVKASPYTYAWYFLCYHIGQKTNFANFGVNFFLYVLSGKKFRSDLVQLFRCFKDIIDTSNNSHKSVEHGLK